MYRRDTRWLALTFFCSGAWSLAACGDDDSHVREAGAANSQALPEADASQRNSNSIYENEPDAGTAADLGLELPDDACPDVTEPFDPGCDFVLAPCGSSAATTAAVESVFLNEAMEGDTVCVSRGTYVLDRGLSIDVNNLRVLGEGAGETIFELSRDADDAIVVTSDGFSASGFSIHSSAGSGIRVRGASNVDIHGILIRLDAGIVGGAHGVALVQCRNGRVAKMEIEGAHESGIYIGQSEMVLVDGNRVTESVAGIEVENSSFTEVAGNELRNNAAGIVVMSVPNLPIPGGQKNKVHDNQVIENNRSFEVSSSRLVGLIPSGTGIVLLATDGNEVHDNLIEGNASLGIGIASWGVTGLAVNQTDFDPWAESNFVHANRLVSNGHAPSSMRTRMLAALTSPENELEDIVFDGDFAPMQTERRDTRNCFLDNVDGSGAPASYLMADAAHGYTSPSTELGSNACDGETLPAVYLGM